MARTALREICGSYIARLRLSPFWVGLGKRDLLEKGSFQKSPFSRDSREFRDFRDSREPRDCGKSRRIRPLSRDSRESRDFWDPRGSSSEKTPFVVTPFSVPETRSSKFSGGRCPTRLVCRWNWLPLKNQLWLDSKHVTKNVRKGSETRNPWSSFPCRFRKRQGKPPKRQGILLLAEPLKSLGKKGKKLKIARNSLKRKKARKSKKAGKGRLGMSPTNVKPLSCCLRIRSLRHF